jgi:hypothetical protein
VLVNLIAAIRSVHSRFGSGFMVTMAPETFFVQVGPAALSSTPFLPRRDRGPPSALPGVVKSWRAG